MVTPTHAGRNTWWRAGAMVSYRVHAPPNGWRWPGLGPCWRQPQLPQKRVVHRDPEVRTLEDAMLRLDGHISVVY